jgi:hypothetical protein
MAHVVDVRTKQRVVTGFLTAEGSNQIQIHRHLGSAYSKDAIDVSSDAGLVILRAVKRHWWQALQCPAVCKGCRPTHNICKFHYNCNYSSWEKIGGIPFLLPLVFIGAHGGTIGSGTVLQTGRSWVWFPLVSVEFFIDIILPATIEPWGRLSL